MEKILLAINSHQINTNTVNFACYIAKITKSKLTALLLKDREAELISADSLNKSFYKKVMDMPAPDKRYIEIDVDQEVRFLLKTCEKNGVQADVIIKRESYEHKNSPADETIEASRFEDLLIIDPRTSFNTEIETLPTSFVKTILSASECPVLIAPDSFEPINDIVFCNDGCRSSFFAMRQFTYLFPQLCDKNVIVLEVGEGYNLKNQEKINTWLQGHYTKIEFQKLAGVAADELFKYFLGKKNSFVVMDGYGRTAISNFFRKSSAGQAVRTVNLPLFISYQ